MIDILSFFFISFVAKRYCEPKYGRRPWKIW